MMKDIDSHLKNSFVNFLNEAAPGLNQDPALAKELAAKLLAFANTWAEYGEKDPARVKSEKEQLRRWVMKNKRPVTGSRLAL